MITQQEFRNNSAAVMDAVETGETFRITRNGVDVAEVRPVGRKRHFTAEELVARHRMLRRVEPAELRRATDEFFGTEDHLGDDDPWARRS